MSIEILLVEDNPGDARLTKEALGGGSGAIHLHVVNDGIEAMAFLRKEGVHSNVPSPDFILLDLNMPRMDGLEVLALIKSDERLKTIPTIILTTSSFEGDVRKTYQLQANCFLNKPLQLDDFEAIVKGIKDFWIDKVRLPKRNQTE
jgi:CheY-like chemotaxis protein